MLNIIVAPIRENDKSHNVTKSIVKYLKEQEIEYSVYFSMDLRGVETNVHELIDAGEEEFVLIGDDKIFSIVVNSIKDLSNVKIGLIPVGDNNDFAKYLGVETNPVKAIKDILEKNIVEVDYLILNDKKVLNNILIGASVETMIAYEQYKLKNFITKKFAQLNYGNKFDGVELDINIKSLKPFKKKIFELIIANGGLSQGTPVSPLSNMSDGLININYSCAHHDKDKSKVFASIRKGEHIYDEDLEQVWTTGVKITNQDNKIKALVDGEYETFESLNISIVNGGLKIYKRN